MRFNAEAYEKLYPREQATQPEEPETVIETFKPTSQEEITVPTSDQEGGIESGHGESSEPDPE